MLALTASGAALAALAWLPFHLAPLLPFAFFLVIRGFDQVTTRRDALLFGVVFAGVRYAIAAHFLLALISFSPLAVVFYLLAILFVLPFGLLEAFGGLWLARRAALPRGLALGAMWTVGELIRTLAGPLAFPADLAAHAFGTQPGFLSLSSLGGPFSVTVLAWLVALALEAAWTWRTALPRRAMAFAGLAAALWLTPPLLAGVLAERGEWRRAEPLEIALVQPSFGVLEKFDRAMRPRLWRELERLSEEAARGADLVVWPESARPEPLEWHAEAPFTDPRMEALSRRLGVPILYGSEIARLEGGVPRALYNGAALVHPDGTPASWYGKQHLLPFAEALPFGELFGHEPLEPGRKASLLTMMGHFSPGPGPTIFELDGARFGVLICYEGLFPGLAARMRREGAQLLVVLTNDAWWGKSAFAPWHARMAATRAVESRVPLVRAANNGVSSATDARGVMLARTRLDERRILRVSVHPDLGPPTLHAKAPWAFPVACLLALGTALVTAPLTRRLRARLAPAGVSVLPFEERKARLEEGS